MKSDPFAQLKLLDIAELDGRVLKLRHAKASLPESAEINALLAQRSGIDNQARDARIAVEDLTAAQNKAEADVEVVRTRRKRDQDRMDAGLISNPKDLEAMTHELANLDRRIGVLEDEELEVMEQLEAAQRMLAEHTAMLEGFDNTVEALVARRDEKAAAIDADIQAVLDERPAAIEGVPDDLLALYTKISETRGVGAGELRARQCGGCGMTLDAAELARIKALPSDEVVRCEECGRIMVRTAESGL